MNHLQKTKKEYQNLKQNEQHQNELDKACFEPDMADGNFKGLSRRTASDKILRDKAFNISKNPKYDGYQRGLVSMVYKLFDKKFLVAVLKMRICQTSFLRT